MLFYLFCFFVCVSLSFFNYLGKALRARMRGIMEKKCDFAIGFPYRILGKNKMSRGSIEELISPHQRQTRLITIKLFSLVVFTRNLLQGSASAPARVCANLESLDPVVVGVKASHGWVEVEARDVR